MCIVLLVSNIIKGPQGLFFCLNTIVVHSLFLNQVEVQKNACAIFQTLCLDVFCISSDSTCWISFCSVIMYHHHVVDFSSLLYTKLSIQTVFVYHMMIHFLNIFFTSLQKTACWRFRWSRPTAEPAGLKEVFRTQLQETSYLKWT